MKCQRSATGSSGIFALLPVHGSRRRWSARLKCLVDRFGWMRLADGDEFDVTSGSTRTGSSGGDRLSDSFQLRGDTDICGNLGAARYFRSVTSIPKSFHFGNSYWNLREKKTLYGSSVIMAGSDQETIGGNLRAVHRGPVPYRWMLSRAHLLLDERLECVLQPRRADLFLTFAEHAPHRARIPRDFARDELILPGERALFEELREVLLLHGSLNRRRDSRPVAWTTCSIGRPVGD